MKTSSARTLILGGYIVSPWYDHLFFIFAPVLALCVGIVARQGGFYALEWVAQDDAGRMMSIAIPTLLSNAFTHAHLLIVFFRSHGNPSIFRLYPYRFTLVPLALLILACLSQWIFVILSVAVIWWDVYHSSLQTFGLGRIYDQRHGNSPEAGRRLDFILNLIIYTGPVLAGVNLAAHLNSFDKFEQVDAYSLADFGKLIFERQEVLQWGVLGVAIPFLIWYGIGYLKLTRSGYRYPRQKLILFLATAIVSVISWGFGSFAEAFLVMNFFHALQYFAIVWSMEKKNMVRLFGLSRNSYASVIALAIFVSIGMGYGLWKVGQPHTAVLVIAAGNVISLMHFWYDGFIWSVRKGQV